MDTERNGPRRSLAWAAGLLATGALAGGILAVSLPAGAQTSPTPSATAPPHDGPRGQRSDETVLTGDKAAKATAAALKALPGATVNRVETDADGAVYEAHVTKADGTCATVKMDKDFKVTSIEEGRGKGTSSST